MGAEARLGPPPGATYPVFTEAPQKTYSLAALVKGKTREGAMSDATGLVRALRWGGEPYKVLGPAPAPLSRLKGEYRVQFFMKGTHRGAMRKSLVSALAARPW